MTAILHYLKVHVHYNKLLLSRIKEEISKEGIVIKPATVQIINEQVADLLKY